MLPKRIIPASESKTPVYEVCDEKNRIKLNSSKTRGSLHSAVEEGNIGAVKTMLSRGFHVDSINAYDRTLLHIACSQGNKKMVQLLLNHNATLDSPDFKGYTPIHLAAGAGHLGVIKLIMKAAPPDRKLAIVHARNVIDGTPLHLAALNGNSKIVKYLIEQGAQVLSTKGGGMLDTPLDFAIAAGKAKAVSVLLNYIPNIQSVPQSNKLIFLAAAGDLFFHKKFINSYKNIMKQSSLDKQRKYIKIIELLLDAGVGSQYCDGKLNPLHAAARRNHYFVVERLLQHGINVNWVDRNGCSALKFAIVTRCDNDLIRLLVKEGADVSDATNLRSHYLPIQWTFLRRNYEILSTLISAGADINAKSNHGFRIFDLIQGYKPNDALYIYIILRYGADINAVGFNGYTALHKLCPFYKFKEAAILFDWNPDFNFMGIHHETPLRYAIDKGHSLYSQEFIIKAIAKIQSHSKFQINSQNENLISRYNFLERFNDYRAELEVLKERKVWGQVTFFELLNKPLHKLREYARNPELVNALNSGICDKYLAYGDLIITRMNFAFRLKNIHENCIYSLEQLVYPIRLPLNITYDVLSLLNVDDMLKLSSMCK